MTAMTIKIALIDDHPMLIRGLKDMLECTEVLKVIGTYLSAGAFLEACKQPENRPDILLLDISMPGMDGETLSKFVQSEYPAIAMIAFTNMEQRYYLRAMVRNGVGGYVLKSSSEEVLLEAIQTVYRKELYFDPSIREEGIKALKMNRTIITPALVLSKREKEVLQLIMENYNSNEIAEKLYISKRTVDFHRTNLLLKLDVKSSASLVKKAIDLGLLK